MPYERRVRQPSKPLLLADLEAADAVEVICGACRHWSLIAPHELLARHPAEAVLATLIERMRCSACGRRQATWTLLRARPPRVGRLN